MAGLVSGIVGSLTVGLLGVLYFWSHAVHNAEISRKALYRTSMNLAASLHDHGDIDGLNQTLAPYGPEGPAHDLADFCWHYYAAQRKPVIQVANHGEVVTDVAVSRDGRLFASAGTDQLIRVWSSQNGQLLRTLQPPTGRIGAIAFSPVDDRLASAHSDGEIRLWNPLQHDHVLREFSHGNGLILVRFSPSGDQLLSGGSKGTVRLWHVGSGEMMDDLTRGTTAVRDLRFSPSGDSIGILQHTGLISFWSLPEREFLDGTLRIPQAHYFDFVDSENTIVTGTVTSALHMVSPTRHDVETTGKADGGTFGDLHALPQADLVAMVTSDYNLFLTDLNLRETRHLPTHTLSHGSLGESHDGRFLVVGSGDGSVKLISVEALRRPDVLWHESHARDVKFLSDGRRYLYCAGDGAVHLCDLQSGQQRVLLPPSGRVMLSLAVEPGGDRVAAAGMSRDLQLLSMDDPGALQTIPLPHAGVSSVRFSHDGRYLATGGRNGTVLIYDLDQSAALPQTDDAPSTVAEDTAPSSDNRAGQEQAFWKPAFTIGHPDMTVHDLAFSPISGILTVALSDGRIEFITPTEGSIEERHVQVPSTPTALMYCDGGRQLAVGTQTGEIEILQMPTGVRVRSIKCHGSRINALAVFPDGTKIASAGRQRNIHIWDTVTGERISTLHGHRKQIFSIAVSDDGQSMVSAGLEGGHPDLAKRSVSLCRAGDGRSGLDAIGLHLFTGVDRDGVSVSGLRK